MNSVSPVPHEPDSDDVETAFLDGDSVDWNDPDIDPAFKAAVEQGFASIDAGRGIPIERVLEWVQSWGTENELPMPE